MLQLADFPRIIGWRTTTSYIPLLIPFEEYPFKRSIIAKPRVSTRLFCPRRIFSTPQKYLRPRFPRIVSQDAASISPPDFSSARVEGGIDMGGLVLPVASYKSKDSVNCLSEKSLLDLVRQFPSVLTKYHTPLECVQPLNERSIERRLEVIKRDVVVLRRLRREAGDDIDFYLQSPLRHGR